MAVPTVTKTGSGSSKTSGTSLAVTVSTTSYALGDYVVCGFSMDPQSGAVSFAKTAGTATVGSWSTIGDVSNGSGTSGVRTVMAYAKVTAAGTITTVTVTHPTATARTAETFNATTADGTTPVAASGTVNSQSGITVSPTPAVSVSYAGLIFTGIEAASGAGILQSAVWQYSHPGSVNFTHVSSDASSVGTSGGGGASNISAGYIVDSIDPLPSDATAVTATGTPSGAQTVATVAALFQGPTGTNATSLVFDERRVRRNHLLRR